MALEVDVAIIGAGGAGLSVLTQVDRLVRAGVGSGGPPSIALIDPVHRMGEDRTWCFWDGGHSDVEAAVHRAWTCVEVRNAQGVSRVVKLDPMRYVMIRSAAFYALADDAAARLGAVRVPAAAQEVLDGPGVALVRAGDELVRARWVLDSRPAPPLRPANTAWLQHFRGWTVDFGADVLDPDVPVFMDLSPVQPPRAVAFGYVLPSDARTALVEYTQFSRERLEDGDYDAALRHYLGSRWGESGVRARVLGVEEGVVPMSDAVLGRRAGRRVFRIGTAGGATRASTGYTFAAMQRQGAAIAGALLAGREPMPPRAYPLRHRWLDSVLLRALDRGEVSGAEVFGRLLAEQPARRLLRFLDGATSPLEELAVMRSTPTGAMLRAVLGDVGARATRRRLG